MDTTYQTKIVPKDYYKDEKPPMHFDQQENIYRPKFSDDWQLRGVFMTDKGEALLDLIKSNG